MDIVTTLTEIEQQELQSAESAIERFRQAFWDAGDALEKIKSLKLYRENYRTFAEYCRSRWNMNRSYADHLIRATAVREILRTTVRIQELADSDELSNIPLPENERQVRPLVPLKEPEQIQQAWMRAVEMSNGQPTAKQVGKAVDELNPKKPTRKRREYTEEEKQQGICDWLRNGGGEGIPSFGVNLHDPKVGIEIERVAEEVGKCNATAIGLGMEAYREMPKLKEELESVKAENERLKQENDELRSAAAPVWDSIRKLQEVQEVQEATTKIIQQKDKQIAELQAQLNELRASTNGHKPSAPRNEEVENEQIPFEQPQSQKCGVGVRVQIVSARHGVDLLGKSGIVVVASDIGCVVEVCGLKKFFCYDELSPIPINAVV